MEWWIVVLTVVIGAGALVFAATADRARAARRLLAAASPPDRHIPSLSDDAPTPAYVAESDALIRTATATDSALDVARLDRAITGATALAGGWADKAFVTHPARNWAVVEEPMVLVCTGVGSFRELLPAVTAAKRANHALVVVAPAMEADAIGTLAANAAQGHLPGVAVTCPDKAALTAIADAAGATLVRRDDLQSGWLPANSYGRCAVWVSDRKSSWALESLDPLST